jgi:hypothetical protein
MAKSHKYFITKDDFVYIIKNTETNSHPIPYQHYRLLSSTDGIIIEDLMDFEYILNFYYISELTTAEVYVCTCSFKEETELYHNLTNAEKFINNNNKEKEEKTMKNFNFDFGPCTNNNVRLSVYGLAVENNNQEWVSYDAANGSIMNVDLLNFDARKYMFKMPVAINDVKVGDVIVHNRVPMFVLGVEDNGIVAVDVKMGEEKKILPTKSPFGFNFITKIICLFDNFMTSGENADSANPFGNMLPLFLMGNEDNEINPMMMYMLMQQNGNTATNPLMLMALMGNNEGNNMLPLMFMMQSNNK